MARIAGCVAARRLDMQNRSGEGTSQRFPRVRVSGRPVYAMFPTNFSARPPILSLC